MKTFKIEIPKGYEIDKEKSTFENIVFKPINKKTEYVNLGLPSGTLWANTNEDGYYSYQEAIDTFGKNNLPKLTDFAELYDYCEWKWDSNSNSMIVTGPNGKHIVLPALGYRYRDGDKMFHINTLGYYWSVTPYRDRAYNLFFSNHIHVDPLTSNNRACGFSIRKIKRE